MDNRTDPIDPKFHQMMNELARELDVRFNGQFCAPADKKIGFFLALYPFNEEGRFNYISNTDALDVRAMLKNVTARIEGRMSEPGKA